MPPELTIDRSAAIDRTDLDGGSWVDLVTGFVRDADDRMDELHRDVACRRPRSSGTTGTFPSNASRPDCARPTIRSCARQSFI